MTKCRAPSRLLGTIVSGPGKCRLRRIGSPYRLPLQVAHFDRQQIGQRRGKVAARAERVEPAEHQQPGPLAERRSASSASSSGRKPIAIDVAQDIDVVLAAGQEWLEIERARARIALGQMDVFDLDVGRGVERAAEKLRFDAQAPSIYRHVQTASQHRDERAQLVVRGDDFARLRFGPHRQFVFAGRLGHVVDLDRQRCAVLGEACRSLVPTTSILPPAISNSSCTGTS